VYKNKNKNKKIRSVARLEAGSEVRVVYLLIVIVIGYRYMLLLPYS